MSAFTSLRSNQNAQQPLHTVLIVDDEPEVRNQLRLRFELEGFKVLDAGGGDAAYAICEVESPDVVITDIRMPGGSGVDLLKRLSSHKRSEMPVIMCISGYSDLLTYQAYQYGAYAVFQKPFDLRDLVFASRRFLELRTTYHSAVDQIAILENKIRTIVTDDGKAGEIEETIHLDDMRRIFGLIIHEINNPLAIIAMNAALMAQSLGSKDSPTMDLLKMVTNVEANCSRVIRTIQALHDLFIAKPEDGAIEVSLDTIADEAMTMLVDEGRLDGIDVRRKRGSGEVRVVGVRQQLVQLVRNLLSNAAYAVKNNKGEKWLEIETSTTADEDSIVVTDNGPGVALEIREKIFDAYFTSKGKDGMGLGLHLCRQIAKAHGGNLHLEPSRHGARFALRIKKKSV